ncbi:hypothetical protein IYZ83_000525 [Wolbachia pipientis]|uniref:hypothetical protein n=1 Tax=Wolbachia pipientis TaxID=955 RepID=UPI001F392115|nr:hypothetical protein [Wolbachia pipientis]UIP91757.1 hypothetical protein IYZ83_000525 [Wolbachia pipientis]
MNTVTNVFKAKFSTSAKTLSSGLFAVGTIGIARAISKTDLSSLQGNSEDEVNKQDLISIDDSSLLTVAIERIEEEQKKNRNYDIHVEIAVSLILGMGKELIIKLENFADSNDETLLHYLAESGKEDILRLVIESFDFNVKEAVRSKDRVGKTPLQY